MKEKLRKENIVWTVSEDYSYSPALNLFDTYEDFDMNYYKMCILGTVYKQLDMDVFFEFMSNCLSKTELKNEFLKVVEIFLDDCFYECTIKERKGVSDYRKKFFDGIEKKYRNLQMDLGDTYLDKISVEEEIEYVYYSSINKKYIKSRDVVDDMVMLLKSKSDHIRGLISLISDTDCSSNEYLHDDSINEVIYNRNISEAIHDDSMNEAIHNHGTSEDLHDDSMNEVIHNHGTSEDLHDDSMNEAIHDDSMNEAIHNHGTSEDLHDDNMNAVIYNRNTNETVSTVNITEDIISAINAVFLKYFYKNIRSNRSVDDILDNDKSNSTKKASQTNEEKNPRLNFKMKKKKLKDMKADDNIGMFTIESAEFTGDLPDDVDINDERLKKKLDTKVVNANSKIRNMILARYGEGIYPEYVTDFIESKICTGIHEGIKIHFTNGRFQEGNYDKYFYNSIVDQRDRNLEYYSDNELIFRRSITELREIIKKKIFVEENDDYISKSGDIIVSKIWRNRVLGDENIFIKKNKDDVGDLSVDILLDSSASQDGREEVVAAQAYVISQALVSLNIPTRVYGFSNFFNYLVMREYRDYNDPISKNKSIFDFKTSGSNRDGLAIKFISKQMETLENNNKILIVLSDGRPNDKINLGAIGFMKIDGKDYEGDVAIKDTASEIFNLKMKGSHVLGVFTGEDEDLEDEKKIYGKDFAYIRKIDRFSRIIGFYLEQLIV